MSSRADLINATGGWTVYGAGLLCDEALDAMAAAGRRSVIMADAVTEADRAISAAFDVGSAFVVHCAAAALAVTAAAALVEAGGDGRQLPFSPPKRRKVLLPKGHALNFSAEVTQMLRMAGAEPVELGAVNNCTAAHVERACQDEDVAAAYYVQSSEAFPYGTLPLEDYVRIAQAAGIRTIVDASAQPLIQPILASGADAVIVSPHKCMGSPTAGIIVGKTSFVTVCRSLETSFARPFKTSKEALAGTVAAIRKWTAIGEGVVHELWEHRARYARSRFADIAGVRFQLFHYPAPIQGIHARLIVDEEAGGLNARQLAIALKKGAPGILVVEEEVDQGALIIHFAMLNEPSIDRFADRVRTVVGEAYRDRSV